MKDKTRLTKIKEDENNINEQNTKIKHYRQRQQENETMPAEMKLKLNDPKTGRRKREHNTENKTGKYPVKRENKERSRGGVEWKDVEKRGEEKEAGKKRRGCGGGGGSGKMEFLTTN
jgi:hypothetical protein